MVKFKQATLIVEMDDGSIRRSTMFPTAVCYEKGIVEKEQSTDDLINQGRKFETTGEETWTVTGAMVTHHDETVPKSMS